MSRATVCGSRHTNHVSSVSTTLHTCVIHITRITHIWEDKDARKHATPANKPTQKKKKENTYDAGTHINTKNEPATRRSSADVRLWKKGAKRVLNSHTRLRGARCTVAARGTPGTGTFTTPCRQTDRQTDRQIDRHNVHYF